MSKTGLFPARILMLVFFLLVSGCATRNVGSIGTGTYHIDEVRSAVIVEDRLLIVEYGTENHEDTFSFISSDTEFKGRESVYGIYTLASFYEVPRNDDDWNVHQSALVNSIESGGGCIPESIRMGPYLMADFRYGQKAEMLRESMKGRDVRKIAVVDMGKEEDARLGETHYFRMVHDGVMHHLGGMYQAVILNDPAGPEVTSCQGSVLYVLPQEWFVFYDEKRLLRWTLTPVAFAVDVVTFPVQFIVGYSLYYGAAYFGSSEDRN